MAACTLIIDTREKMVTRHQNELTSINTQILQITTGDYAIMYNDRVLVTIERKSFDDFGASLVDGRHSNKEKLIKLRNDTGCSIIFIIEGNAFPNPNDTYARVPYRYIESAIFHMMVRDNITIIRTKDTLDTAKTLVRFVQSMNTLVAKKDFTTHVPTAHVPAAPIEAPIDNQIDLLTVAHTKSDHEVVREMWAKFRGISIENADDLIVNCSLKDLFTGKINPNDLKSSTGKKLNKSILRSISHIDTAVESKILSAIPGISVATSIDIIKSVSIRRLISYPAEAISIIKVGKSKRNLGMASANNIIKYLSYTTKVDDIDKILDELTINLEL